MRVRSPVQLTAAPHPAFSLPLPLMVLLAQATVQAAVAVPSSSCLPLDTRGQHSEGISETWEPCGVFSFETGMEGFPMTRDPKGNKFS